MRYKAAVAILTLAWVGLPALTNADVFPLTLDFEADGVGNPLEAGQIIDDEFAAFGIQVSAENYAPGHPDLAIIFDSANPTGGDDDLATPNPAGHPSNTVPYDNILILAENDIDLDGDGLIDNPDDEAHRPAGYLHFSLGGVYEAADFVFIDTEEAGGTVEFFLSGGSVGSVPIPAIPNAAVVPVSFSDADFDAFQVNLAGSGGLCQFELVPEPSSLLLLIGGSVLCLSRRR